MKPVNIYVPISVEDELPKEKGWYLCKITNADNKMHLNCDCPYDAELKQFGDVDEDGEFMPLYNAIVTHWLKPQQDKYIFSKEELENFVMEVWMAQKLEIGLEEFLKSKDISTTCKI